MVDHRHAAKAALELLGSRQFHGSRSCSSCALVRPETKRLLGPKAATISATARSLLPKYSAAQCFSRGGRVSTFARRLLARNLAGLTLAFSSAASFYNVMTIALLNRQRVGPYLVASSCLQNASAQNMTLWKAFLAMLS